MKTIHFIVMTAAVAAVALAPQGCTAKEHDGEKQMNVTSKPFGTAPGGKQADIYTLTNDKGVEVKITNYGGIVTSLKVPDRNGDFSDVVLGYDTLDEYVKDNSPYFGALVGRYGNRIAGGTFTLEGKQYTLARNNGPNHLHGGNKGFDKVLWDAQPVRRPGTVGVKLTYLSRDGEEGYPGNLSCEVVYELTGENELKINYRAVTDKTTVVNLTHHSYFNLAGHDSGDILSHELMINAGHYTPVDETLIPTGQIKTVDATPMDFRKPVAIGSRIDQVTGGYDHNYELDKAGGGLTLAARVREKSSGRVMEVWTTEPGIQFYSGNFLDGTQKGKGVVYEKYAGFCLETQHFPDSPNRPQFPSVVLKPSQEYSQTTVYKFACM